MKLLVANRGEIAVRVMRACRDLGITTVAVYSEVDRLSPHVLTADEAVPLGGRAAADSYLKIDKLVDAALRSGAQLVHPGYGFLAESPEFAKAVKEAGLTWVGPPENAIAVMGSKTESRNLAKKAGVNVIPGTMEPVSTFEEAEKVAESFGYPVLLKAVAGGGGKGMRTVREPGELKSAFERARSEGKAYFGDDRVYIEKLLEKPRHIEVQVAADKHGNKVHVGERECSIQRRHQKVVEECPSPVVDSKTRQELGEAALAIVEAAGYHSVGTVEFLMDSSGKFYFLEMNTRLQVEHPITEEVYGVDLVVEQIKIALGEKLALSQETLTPRGHAIECRIYAEDPLRNFAPSPGKVSYVREPSGPGIRVDSGIAEGVTVPLEYDPLLAKLIAWGPDRNSAVARLARALDEYLILGVATTIPLFKTLVKLKPFVEGDLHTGFLDEHLETVRSYVGKTEGEDLAAAVAACLATTSSSVPEPFGWTRGGQWWEEGLRMLHGRFPR